MRAIYDHNDPLHQNKQTTVHIFNVRKREREREGGREREREICCRVDSSLGNLINECVCGCVCVGVCVCLCVCVCVCAD